MLPYRLDDKASIIAYAKKLEGQTLRMACDAGVASHNYAGKGNFGQVLEKFYFLYEPNSDAEPDFPEVGLELKTTPLKRLQNQEYRSKERLVLNKINYLEIVRQDFETSAFWKKNANLLLVFYIHQPNSDILDFLIPIVGEWRFSDVDLEIIKNDWEIIQQKVVQGRAHELSEGDTFYLGACTKGAKGDELKKQPNSEIPAKPRAYSLKQGYVNHVIASLSTEKPGIYGRIIPSPSALKKQTMEEIVVSKFERFYNQSVDEILNALNVSLNKAAKSFHADLTKAILGIELDKEIEEFEKADIIVKTIRLKPNNLPKEDISFPSFKFEKLVEEDWEDSDFKDTLEHKFLFVFFQFTKNQTVLRRVKFWNMPFQDIQEAKKVWEETQTVVATGNIIKAVIDGKRHTNFPNKSFNRVSHVRPHASNAQDTYPLPTTDQLTNLKAYTKHSFWLNNHYIRDEIYLK